MSKVNLKIITLFIILLFLFNLSCFASNTSNAIMPKNSSVAPISDDTAQTKYSDLYISEDEYDIKNIIAGNVFASVNTLNIDSSNNGGIIQGNLYVTANTINIKSNLKYSQEEKDELGNSLLEEAVSLSKIDGNVFVTADKFILEPECQINGDLYICATEVDLGENAIINGNVFVFGNKLVLNSKINGGSLYANVKNFDMKYYGFISKDLYLSTKTANLGGCINRNSFINADDITMTYTFINKGNLKIKNSSNVAFSGEIRGNANINSKNINFKSKDDNGKNITCKISGNLDYSSKEESNFENKIVFGNINYSEYKSYNNFGAKLLNYLISLITTIIYVFVIYIIIIKFMPSYINKLHSVDYRKLLLLFGLGICVLILAPILSILLFITQVGAILGLLLLLAYIFVLIIAKPILIIWLSTIINNKNMIVSKSSELLKSFVPILGLIVILSLINLIPYAGFIISLLITIVGLGLIIKSK